MSEWPSGVIVDPHTMEQVGEEEDSMIFFYHEHLCQIKHYEYKEEGNFLGDGSFQEKNGMFWELFT